MRPNVSKPKPEPTLQVPDDPDDEAAVVAETQVDPDAVFNGIDSDDNMSDYASDASHTPKRRKTVKNKAVSKAKPKDGVVKTAARKIKATAHANYRKLQIKSSKGAKGGGPTGKFGRRR